MTKPILYFSLLSVPVRAVLLTAKAIKLELELREIDILNGQQLTEEFIKINPQHTVPTLDDNGKIFWDSHAINTYLIDKYGGNDLLYPKDLYKRALINQRLFYDCSVHFNCMEVIINSIFFKGLSVFTIEQEEEVNTIYQTWETSLQGGGFLVGDTMTVADLSCIPLVTSFSDLIQIDGVRFPKLVNYIERMSQLPYYDQINKAGAEILIGVIKKQIKENIRLNVQTITN